jgi:hypothetical protein
MRAQMAGKDSKAGVASLTRKCETLRAKTEKLVDLLNVRDSVEMQVTAAEAEVNSLNRKLSGLDKRVATAKEAIEGWMSNAH